MESAKANGLGRYAHLFQALTELPYLAKRLSQGCRHCLCCEKYANHWGALMGPQFFVDGGFVCTYKGITRLLGRGSVRITPAHVGKRRLPDVQKHKARDHPRTRGEKLSLQLLSAASLGSPPRMRGKDDLLAAPRLGGGITPAHAGKSLLVSRSRCGQRDHPRTRGEKDSQRAQELIGKGSPPHTRGKATGIYHD